MGAKQHAKEDARIWHEDPSQANDKGGPRRFEGVVKCNLSAQFVYVTDDGHTRHCELHHRWGYV